MRTQPFSIFTLPPATPQPCVTVEWQATTQSVTVGGQPLVLQTSVGLCKAANQVVQGTVLIMGAQTKASGR